MVYVVYMFIMLNVRFRAKRGARYLRGMAISSPSAGRPGGVGGSPKKFSEKFSGKGLGINIIA